MSEKGFFKLDRAILEHPLWLEKPFSSGQAWADLIGLANYKTIRKKRGDKFVTYKRGTVFWSILALADRWGWERKKVRRFLSVLEDDNMVVVNGSRHGTTITIVNYGKYQNQGSTEWATDGTRDGHDMGHELPIRERKKEYKERKNDVYAPHHPPTLFEVRAYFTEAGLTTSPEGFWRYYDANGWRLAGGDPVQNWKLAAQKWRDYGEANRGEDPADRNPRQRDGYGEAEAELFGVS